MILIINLYMHSHTHTWVLLFCTSFSYQINIQNKMWEGELHYNWIYNSHFAFIAWESHLKKNSCLSMGHFFFMMDLNHVTKFNDNFNHLVKFCNKLCVCKKLNFEFLRKFLNSLYSWSTESNKMIDFIVKLWKWLSAYWSF